MLLSSVNRFIKGALVGFASITLCIEFVYHKITKSIINSNDVSVLINADEHVPNYLFASAAQWILPFILIIFFFASTSKLVKADKRQRIKISIGVILLFLSVIFSYNILKKSNGIRTSFPSIIKLPVLYYYAQDNGLYNGKRAEVNLEQTKFDGVDHIILIVDESVRGDLLQINNEAYENTPFINSVLDSNIINYGVSYSASVCSDYSNILLMTGLSLDQIPELNQRCSKNATLFQYAKAALYSTAFIDCQSSSNRPDGFMTNDDKAHIDDYIQVKSEVPSLEDYKRDRKGIDLMVENLSEHDKSFTYFIKYGCHFPYENTYPKDSMFNKPIASIIDWELESRDAVLNNYHNSIKWSVDDFFEELADKLPPNKEVLVVYTSDHGQNLIDDVSIPITHCHKGQSPSVMAQVPLLFYSQNNGEMSKLISGKNQIREGFIVSHFNVFSTVLDLMDINSSFNDYSLLNPNPKQVSQFVSGDIFGRNQLYFNNIPKQ
jgi:glucan phosphoethanolaminetransferase (alkaline phosphatase superfamily)